LTGKCFPLTNFPNDKQTQESLESDFPETIFQKTNPTKMHLNYGGIIGILEGLLQVIFAPRNE
jgi:hypothetical protein